MIPVEIPPTVAALLARAARGDRARKHFADHGLAWPSLEQECAAREAEPPCDRAGQQR